MKKYIGFFGILMGVISIFSYFSTIHIDLYLFLAIDIIGLLISSFAFFKYKKHLLGLLGFILNFIPMIYCIILFSVF